MEKRYIKKTTLLIPLAPVNTLNTTDALATHCIDNDFRGKMTLYRWEIWG